MIERLRRQYRRYKIPAVVIAVSICTYSEFSFSDDGFCWESAAQRYGVDPLLLYVIAEKESAFDRYAINSANKNKSRDVGLMQINSIWFEQLERDYGITEQNLYDPCTSINVGAWVLANSIRRYGNTWRAVGAYNAGTGKDAKREALRERYAADVYKRYQRVVSGLRVNK